MSDQDKDVVWPHDAAAEDKTQGVSQRYKPSRVPDTTDEDGDTEDNTDFECRPNEPERPSGYFDRLFGRWIQRHEDPEDLKDPRPKMDHEAHENVFLTRLKSFRSGVDQEETEKAEKKPPKTNKGILRFFTALFEKRIDRTKLTSKHPNVDTDSDMAEDDEAYFLTQEDMRKLKMKPRRTLRAWTRHLCLIIAACVFTAAVGVLYYITDANQELLGVPVVILCFYTMTCITSTLFIRFLMFIIKLCVSAFAGYNFTLQYYLASLYSPCGIILFALLCIIYWNITFKTEFLSFLYSGDRAGQDYQKAATWVRSADIAILVTGIGLFIKGVLVKKFAVRFHHRKYFKRIENALFAEYAFKKIKAKVYAYEIRMAEKERKLRSGHFKNPNLPGLPVNIHVDLNNVVINMPPEEYTFNPEGLRSESMLITRDKFKVNQDLQKNLQRSYSIETTSTVALLPGMDGDGPPSCTTKLPVLLAESPSVPRAKKSQSSVINAHNPMKIKNPASFGAGLSAQNCGEGLTSLKGPSWSHALGQGPNHLYCPPALDEAATHLYLDDAEKHKKRSSSEEDALSDHPMLNTQKQATTGVGKTVGAGGGSEKLYTHSRGRLTSHGEEAQQRALRMSHDDKKDARGIRLLKKFKKKSFDMRHASKLLSVIRLEGDLVKIDAFSNITRELGDEEDIDTYAQRLYYSILPPDKMHLDISDFKSFFRTRRRVERGFLTFDANHDGRVSIADFVSTVKHIVEERQTLKLMMQDSNTTVSKLNHLMTALTFTVLMFFYIPIFGYDVASFIAVYSGIVVASAFIFGDTFKAVFEGAIYNFVIHPFDVGDRVEIADYPPMFVEQVQFFCTVFRRWSGEIIYYPNSELGKIPLINHRRSGNMCDQFEFYVDRSMMNDKLDILRTELIRFIKLKSEDYYPELDLMYYDMLRDNSILVHCRILQRGNWQDGGQRVRRRHELMAFIKLVFLEHNILCYDLPRPFLDEKTDVSQYYSQVSVFQTYARKAKPF